MEIVLLVFRKEMVVLQAELTKQIYQVVVSAKLSLHSLLLQMIIEVPE